jgi:hypothetical protein
LALKSIGIIDIGDAEVSLVNRYFDELDEPKPVFWNTRKILACNVADHLMHAFGFANDRQPLPKFNAVCSLVYNMAVSVSFSDDDGVCPIVVSRNPHTYTGEPVGYHAMMNVLDEAMKAGLVEQQIGAWKGQRTEVWPTATFRRQLADAKQFEFESLAEDALIVMKDKEGNVVPLPDSPGIALLQEKVRRINESARLFNW